MAEASNSRTPATRTVEKLTAFLAGLDPEEQAVMASLLGPRVAGLAADRDWSAGLLARALDDFNR